MKYDDPIYEPNKYSVLAKKVFASLSKRFPDWLGKAIKIKVALVKCIVDAYELDIDDPIRMYMSILQSYMTRNYIRESEHAGRVYKSIIKMPRYKSGRATLGPDFFEDVLKCNDDVRFQEFVESWESEFFASAPTNASEFLIRANIYAEKGLTAKAFEDYDQAMRFEPNDAMIWFGRGSMFLHMQEWKRAEQDFSKALELIVDKSSSEGKACYLTTRCSTYIYRADALFHMGKVDRAINDCKIGLMQIIQLLELPRRQDGYVEIDATIIAPDRFAVEKVKSCIKLIKEMESSFENAGKSSIYESRLAELKGLVLKIRHLLGK